MKKVKIIFYLKDLPKPIVLSEFDGSSSKQEISEKVHEFLKVDSVYKYETGSDILIIRSSDVKAVLITERDAQITD